jgi:predicted TPR repeat methyltransferase
MAADGQDDDAPPQVDSRNDDPLAAAYEAGLAHEKAGDLDAAAAAYRRVLALDPDDRGGASVRLAALGRGAPPERAPPAYVATLFDQHAAAFDDILVGQLDYRTPQDIAQALAPLGRFPRLLDLGCGTGLVAAALHDATDHRTGVDLAEGMLEQADDKGDYDDLYLGDAEGFLAAAAAEGETWDLIVAADVLPYLGAVDDLLAAAADRLTPGGALVFSTERSDDPPPPGWRVNRGHRYAHHPEYLSAILRRAGLTLATPRDIVVRMDDGAPVRGHLFLARKPG